MSNSPRSTKIFNFFTKVYYEDTDAQGVVYYANYLKFIERARTEMIIACGTSLTKLHEDYSSRFIVKSCNLDFIQSAHLEDLLQIKTYLNKISNASFILNQNIFCNDSLILKAEVVIVCINNYHKPSKIPDFLKKKIISLMSQS